MGRFGIGFLEDLLFGNDGENFAFFEETKLFFADLDGSPTELGQQDTLADFEGRLDEFPGRVVNATRSNTQYCTVVQFHIRLLRQE